MNHEDVGGIRGALLRIGAIKSGQIEVMAERTRDVPGLRVYRDRVTRVIFIDNHYVGDEVYTSGNYRDPGNPASRSANRDHEDATDSERRFSAYRQLIDGKDYCDFGCGAGSFLQKARHIARSACGVELQRDYARQIQASGLACHHGLADIGRELDVISLFHCLEHLPNPVSTLEEIRGKLRGEGKGTLIIEVPHARDLLIDTLASEKFISATLWSQHLTLHTRESLRLLLGDAGFRNIFIEGVQRYGVANHLNWLANGTPGGHKAPLSIIQTAALTESYAQALAKIDATDTLVAVATT
jgi:2-polyprenyl-3-methyl-5-hydroxy-6-metoxy-1,4-benzoquinol methylase